MQHAMALGVDVQCILPPVTWFGPVTAFSSRSADSLWCVVGIHSRLVFIDPSVERDVVGDGLNKRTTFIFPLGLLLIRFLDSKAPLS